MNKAIFWFRAFFATIITAYFTALNFSGSIAGEANLLPFFEAYVAVIFSITAVAFFLSISICFYEYIYQDLLEDAINCAAKMEGSPDNVDKPNMLRKDGSKITSVRIAWLSFIFYFMPISVLFVFIYYTASVVVSQEDDFITSEIVRTVCMYAETQRLFSPPGSVDLSYFLDPGKLSCEDGKRFYKFEPEYIQIVSIGYVACFMYLLLYFCYTSQRIFLRLYIYFGWDHRSLYPMYKWIIWILVAAFMVSMLMCLGNQELAGRLLQALV